MGIVEKPDVMVAQSEILTWKYYRKQIFTESQILSNVFGSRHSLLTPSAAGIPITCFVVTLRQCHS